MLTGCLDALELDSAHVVGHSQGAMLGLRLALDASEQVRSLVVPEQLELVGIPPRLPLGGRARP
jgi:pimeloyl-ACP methyl ester carboxylesterase